MEGAMDYYRLLGVERSSTAKQISTAFRKLAKLHHPDVATTEVARIASEAFFKKLSEAFQCLSDESKRRTYDAKLAGVAYRGGDTYHAHGTGVRGRGAYYAPPTAPAYDAAEAFKREWEERARVRRAAAREERRKAASQARGAESASAEPVPVVESAGVGVSTPSGLGRGRGGHASGRNSMRRRG